MNAEQPIPDSAELVWHKSSHSGGDGGECVEVAVTVPTVHVRDSKNVRGPRLSFGVSQWAAFVDFTAGR
ncbi:DUF397 domain-containing protein [Streptomyces macrosporus]|uniref:DUF397 domain-containing protein n=1 Tax=Streptomyces macrosporus TaxID=44032 RepID=A0ABP5XUA3_9ACTN